MDKGLVNSHYQESIDEHRQVMGNIEAFALTTLNDVHHSRVERVRNDPSLKSIFDETDPTYPAVLPDFLTAKRPSGMLTGMLAETYTGGFAGRLGRHTAARSAPLARRRRSIPKPSPPASHRRKRCSRPSPPPRRCRPATSAPPPRHRGRLPPPPQPSPAPETRNVRLGLCTDGFQPFGSFGKQYSSWPVIVTPYNLPPWMCMKEQYMFLSVLVPGPQNPKDKLDVFLQALIEELKQLWSEGAVSYDVSKKQNFQMRAALMWTISDFPAYSMLSGWSTSGRMACPYCMERSDAFTLIKSMKQSWFDNHRKFLECDHRLRKDKKYFRKNRKVEALPPHVRSGTEILAEIERLGLLKVTDENAEHVNGLIARSSGWRKRSIFWDLPYWSTNLIRHNLDVMHIEKNVFDNVFNTVMNVKGKTKDTVKSRDELAEYCHRPELHADASGKYPKASYTLDKRSKRLIPIAFRELLPHPVWKALTELSLFFRNLSARVIGTADMSRLEPRIDGPVQYRWMYPFERYLRKLKNNVRNKACVEGSIAKAFLVEEASNFVSYYFDNNVSTKRTNLHRNEEVQNDEDDTPNVLSVFKNTGEAFSAAGKRFFDDIIMSSLSSDLINPGAGQGEVIGEEVPVLRGDDGAVMGPNEPSDGEGRLLRIRNSVGWNGEVGNVGST
ncbi:mitochondrial pyruvate carrier 3 [Phtheirospermum japonicum]|uniref:Mitochondrial pyruvate carrier 3 n=1 Tax=Phtheirospermum japonicum TaxID=374723 RepID=A0A830CVI6_9LAMI|nr:mitochondrial pyruvate carrier 3 [Phtheirospermum japonicum]